MRSLWGLHGVHVGVTWLHGVHVGMHGDECGVNGVNVGGAWV